MLTAAALAFVNHLLAGEKWAMSRLRPFAGQTVWVRCPPFDARVRITDAGTLHAVTPDTASEGAGAADVTLDLPSESLWRMLVDRQAAFAAARINGSADLAESLAFILRNLGWDIEDDLSHIVGDIAARRLVQGGKALAAWQSAAAEKLAQNLAEYFSEEFPLIARQADMAAFVGDIDALARRTAHLEQRLDAITRAK